VSEGALFFMESWKFIQTSGARASSEGKANNVEARLTFGTLCSTARIVIVDLAKPHQLVQFCENRAISSAQKSSWILLVNKFITPLAHRMQRRNIRTGR
jgi:hypothetical protein